MGREEVGREEGREEERREADWEGRERLGKVVLDPSLREPSRQRMEALFLMMPLLQVTSLWCSAPRLAASRSLPLLARLLTSLSTCGTLSYSLQQPGHLPGLLLPARPAVGRGARQQSQGRVVVGGHLQVSHVVTCCNML